MHKHVRPAWCSAHWMPCQVVACAPKQGPWSGSSHKWDGRKMSKQMRALLGPLGRAQKSEAPPRTQAQAGSWYSASHWHACHAWRRDGPGPEPLPTGAPSQGHRSCDAGALSETPPHRTLSFPSGSCCTPPAAGRCQSRGGRRGPGKQSPTPQAVQKTRSGARPCGR